MWYLRCCRYTLNSCAACGDVEGLLRLVGGQERGEGRLEYCSGGEWGTVCNQGWDLIDARVACAQLIPGGDPNGKLNQVLGFVPLSDYTHKLVQRHLETSATQNLCQIPNCMPSGRS